MHSYLRYLQVFFAVVSICACGKKKVEEETNNSFLPVHVSSVIQSLQTFSTEPTATDSPQQSILRSILNVQTEDGFAFLAQRIDQEIAAINLQIASSSSPNNPSCWSGEPQSRSILTPDDAAFTIKLQCYTNTSDEFTLFGGVSGSETSIYIRRRDFIALINQSVNSGSVASLDGFASQSYNSGSTKPSAVVRFSAQPAEAVWKLSIANQGSVCGFNYGFSKSSVHAKGSIVTSGTNCSEVNTTAFSSTDFSETRSFEANQIYSDIIGRKAGVTPSGKVVTEYGNQSGLGNTSFESQSNPNIGARDLNFGPLTASELGGSAL